MNDIHLSQLQQVVEIGKEILAELDIDRVLAAAMDHLIKISGAERGLIILFDATGAPLFQTARQWEREDINHPEFEISRTILEKIKSQHKPIYLKNALEDPAMAKSGSVRHLKILSVICLPLIYRGENFGVIYLDNRTVAGIFTREMFNFLESFADFISIAAHHALERKTLQNRQQALERELHTRYGFEAIIGHSPVMQKVFALLEKINPGEARVLIEGESGTGKELVARTIHHNGPRKERKFIPVDCGALPEALLESELFGHVKGAFTGAIADKKGLFEVAHEGTLFLDEITNTTPAFQTKLLRAIQEGEIKPVGAAEPRQVDVRIIAATSGNLKAKVAAGEFREDLYYRLNVITIHLPPLRERKDDIRLLAAHFLKKFSEKTKPAKRVHGFTTSTMRLLEKHDWPGNIRELENVIERAISLALPDDELISP
ncbi:MAG: sigma 54-interacting transcriptional regulator, partial [bacterium]